MAMLLPAAAAAIGSAVANALSASKKKGRGRRRRAATTRVAVTARPARRPKRRSRMGARARVKGRNSSAQTAIHGITLTHPADTFIPSAETQVGGSSNFAIGPYGGKHDAEVDTRDAITCIGSSELNAAIRTGTDYAEDAKNGGFATAGGTAIGAVEIRPYIVGPTSSKLAAFASIYSSYRFRKLTFRFVPAANSSNSAQVYLSFDPDPDASGITTASTGWTPASIRELTTSLVTSCWQKAGCTYLNNGSRCWANDASDSADERAQGILMCAVRGGGASTVYGRIEVDYVCDFFQIRFGYGAPSANVDEKSDSSCARCGAPSSLKRKREDEGSAYPSKRTSYVSVSNDDVKSLFEENLTSSVERPLLKRSEPIPIPRPAIISKTQDGKEKRA